MDNNILLTGGLPLVYRGRRINADYRNIIALHNVFNDDTLNDTLAVYTALQLFYADPVDAGDVENALADMSDFIGGKPDAAPSSGAAALDTPHNDTVVCFNQDAGLILASFLQYYSINLTTIPFLHWWAFIALLQNLPPDSEMRRVMYYRGVEVDALPKAERKHAREMKSAYKIKTPTAQKRALTLDQLNAQARERVLQRHAEAKKALEAAKKENR